MRKKFSPTVFVTLAKLEFNNDINVFQYSKMTQLVKHGYPERRFPPINKKLSRTWRDSSSMHRLRDLWERCQC